MTSEIEELREYLRIDTRQPRPDYERATAFLEKKCRQAGATGVIVKEYVPGKPILVATFAGSESSLKSLLLNSHVDVVPTVDGLWKHPPLDAVLEDGDCGGPSIYARGSQDMKSVGMAYLHALQRMSSEGLALRRAVHVCFVPDEEIGGADGTAMLVQDLELMQTLNVGLVIDEGIPNPSKQGPIYVFRQERTKAWYRIVVSGPAGHGSTLPTGTAAEKLTRLLGALDQLRRQQIAALAKEQGMLGNVTSINVTMVSSDSSQVNVIPSSFVVDVDVRIGVDFCRPGEDEAFTPYLGKLVSNAVPDSNLGVVCKMDAIGDVSAHTELEDALEELFGRRLCYKVFPGGTDARFWRREAQVPAYGLTLFEGMPIRLHDHDEYIPVTSYIDGIVAYKRLVQRLCC